MHVRGSGGPETGPEPTHQERNRVRCMANMRGGCPAWPPQLECIAPAPAQKA